MRVAAAEAADAVVQAGGQVALMQGYDPAAADLVAVIREVRPQVLVTYDDFGGYGHPDHIQAHRVATYAADLAGAPAFRPELGSSSGFQSVQFRELEAVLGHEAGQVRGKPVVALVVVRRVAQHEVEGAPLPRQRAEDVAAQHGRVQAEPVEISR